MHKLACCFTWALQSNRTLIPANNYFAGLYATNDDVTSPCVSVDLVSGEGDMTCFFKSISKCSPWMYEDQNRGNTSHVDFIKFSWLSGRGVNLTKAFSTLVDVPKLRQSFHDESHLIAWLQSMLIGYLFQPNADVKDFIDKSKTAMDDGFEARYRVKTSINHVQQYYGVHIRRTDKWKEEQHRNISEYTTALIELERRKPHCSALSRTNESNRVCVVFLATDDPKIISNFTRLLYEYTMKAHMIENINFTSTYNISCNHSNSDRCNPWAVLTKMTSRPTAEIVQHNRSTWIGTARAIADIDVLANSIGFVGTQSSNFGRCVFELMTFRNSPPVTSVDDRMFSLGGAYNILRHVGRTWTEGFRHVFHE